MEIEERASPNHGPRRGVARPDMVVLHYTGMASAEAARARLSDPAAEVSAHYLIDLGGGVLRLVPEDRRAWHAGHAGWGAVADINSHSVGIELANPGTGPAAHPFPEPQIAALEALLSALLARHRIPPERVLGHACVAPGRKIDPGPRFDWRRLACGGLSIWPEERGLSGDLGSAPGPADAARFRRAARAFGYPLGAGVDWDAENLSVWRAFAERFRPGEAGAPTAAGVDMLEKLAARWPAMPASPHA
ncbi:MAG: N-acetylmuramoyl-L-alanine amidase [Paracoccaceae bacterium]